MKRQFFIVGMCALMFSLTALSGEEGTDNDHIPVGTRAESKEEQLEQKKTRALASYNLESPEAASAKSLKSKGSVYSTSHPGALHHPMMMYQRGGALNIETEDGAIWEISHGDERKVLNWQPNDMIVITPNHSWFSSYQFILTNQNSGVAVAANLFLGPLYHGLYTHWIVAIDDYFNTIYLEDGSVWSMSILDAGTIDSWEVNDTVIIGVNDGAFSSWNPNILINVDMLNYAAGIAAF